MLKAALLCSAICTAFVVGGHPSAPPQDKPVKVANPVSLHEALKPFVGKNCWALATNGRWFLSFQKKERKPYKFDMLGVDFLRLFSKEQKFLIPFSAIREISID